MLIAVILYETLEYVIRAVTPKRNPGVDRVLGMLGLDMGIYTRVQKTE